MDLAKDVTTGQTYTWDETSWAWGKGYGRLDRAEASRRRRRLRHQAQHPAAARRPRLPRHRACRRRRPAEEILAHKPDGVFLSNGPGDPAATGDYAVPAIKGVIEAGVPTFGICLGHQMLGLALGGTTVKMHQGHHGANHPVKDLTTGKVEITSMNHGFAVDTKTLPDGVEETHVSLFDGSNCGLRLKDKPVFSVQYHPEASPGPRDSRYLFERFVGDDGR